MRNHYKFWIILSFIAVFIVGTLAGVLIDKHLLPAKGKSHRDRRPPRFPTLEIMAEELKLTSEQEEAIRSVFHNNEERLKKLGHLIHERISAIRSQLKEEIKNILTKEQNIKFEEMIKRYIEQRKKEMDKRKARRKEREK
jgi:Spy/CpxP family protein refolding chaperone